MIVKKFAHKTHLSTDLTPGRYGLADETRFVVVYKDGSGDTISVVHGRDGLPSDRLGNALEKFARVIKAKGA